MLCSYTQRSRLKSDSALLQHSGNTSTLKAFLIACTLQRGKLRQPKPSSLGTGCDLPAWLRRGQPACGPGLSQGKDCIPSSSVRRFGLFGVFATGQCWQGKPFCRAAKVS